MNIKGERDKTMVESVNLKGALISKLTESNSGENDAKTS